MLDTLALRYPDDIFFAHERDHILHAALGQIRQTFDGIALYPTTQEKAGNLLYLLVKDHPFNDGNKRSAAALFTYFLNLNGALTLPSGESLLSVNTLVAATMLVSMSDPKEKERIIALVRTLLVPPLRAG